MDFQLALYFLEQYSKKRTYMLSLSKHVTCKYVLVTTVIANCIVFLYLCKSISQLKYLKCIF